MPKKEKPLSYERALARVEEIVAELERGGTGLDELSDRLREAQELLAFCKEKLLKAETDINKLLENGKR